MPAVSEKHTGRSERQGAATVVRSVKEGSNVEFFPGISMDPKIRFGKPCIAGTRIDVATVLSGLASGASADELASEYDLTREQISAALHYAAQFSG